MTILATHFAIVLGAWRLRVRIDIDEPREADLRDEAPPAAEHAASAATQYPPHVAARGRG